MRFSCCGVIDPNWIGADADARNATDGAGKPIDVIEPTLRKQILGFGHTEVAYRLRLELVKMVNSTRGVDTCPQCVFTDLDLSYIDHVISPTGVTTELVFHSGTFPFNRGTSIGFKVSVADGVQGGCQTTGSATVRTAWLYGQDGNLFG